MTTSVPQGSSARVARNDYSTVPCPPIGEWTPAATVSVVIPAFANQDKLDLTLAALAGQSYPEDLLEVIVVDDQSSPPLELPEIRPAKTTLLVNNSDQWASAAAVDTGIQVANGSIILRLDSDVIPGRTHVEAHARWHHQADYLTVIGNLHFVDIEPDELSPAATRDAVAAGSTLSLFGDRAADSSWVVKLVNETDRLRDDEWRAFSASNGATISFTRRMYDACGGLDTAMRLGGDTELGYRLAQHGAVFIPDSEAEVWHLGLSQMKSAREEGGRYRRPFVANRVPTFRYMRTRRGMTWDVAYVEVVVDVSEASLEAATNTVASLLGGALSDIAVTLVGPWESLTDERVSPLGDPLLDLRLIHEAFRGESRVRFAAAAEPSAAPVPFRLTMPAGYSVAPDGLWELTDLANKVRVGRVNLTFPGIEEAPAAVLERTAARARAELVREPGEALDAAMDAVWGVWWADGSEWFKVERQDQQPRRLSQNIKALEQRVAELTKAEAELRARAARWNKTGNAARAEAKEWERQAAEWMQAAKRWQLAASPGWRSRLRRLRGRG
jgi:GT2 family glycosyltransferase